MHASMSQRNLIDNSDIPVTGSLMLFGAIPTISLERSMKQLSLVIPETYFYFTCMGNIILVSIEKGNLQRCFFHHVSELVQSSPFLDYALG